MTDILIIGAGTAGLTAGIYAARAGKSVKILDSLIFVAGSKSHRLMDQVFSIRVFSSSVISSIGYSHCLIRLILNKKNMLGNRYVHESSLR